MSDEAREKLRTRAETRYFALETLKSVVDYINSTNPQTLYNQPGKLSVSPDEEFKLKMRDWTQQSGDLIKKCNRLPELLIEDAIAVMQEISGGRPTNAQPLPTQGGK